MLAPAFAVLLLVSTLPGCDTPQRVETIETPYERRLVFAVAPLRNESGSRYADGTRVADKVTQRLALTRGLETLPVNRVLAAMEALGLQRIATKADAMRVRQTLGVDGLLVGSVTAYDPYTPPKLGLSLELYLDGRVAWRGTDLDPRELSASPTDTSARLPGATITDVRGQPATAIAGFYDAADPNVVDLLAAYVAERKPASDPELALRRHTLSIDLYTEFVSYQLTARLLDAERYRLRRPQPEDLRPRNQPATTQQDRNLPRTYGGSGT
ncbi:MAG: hypothetical protein AAF710_12490 [Planctomycetota bacterium]